MSRKRSSWSPLLAAVSLCALGGAAQAESFESLRGGGRTLFLRHAAAEWSGPANEIGALDASKLDAKSCASKRALTEDGRLQAQSVANALLGLEVGPLDVQAAGLCRTFETARLLGANPRIVEGLTPVPGRVPSLRAQGEAIEKIVRAGEQARGLRIIVGDYEAVQALYGVTLGEGDGLVLKVEAGEVAAIARIRASDWTALQPVASGERPATGTRKF